MQDNAIIKEISHKTNRWLYSGSEDDARVSLIPGTSRTTVGGLDDAQDS